MKKKLFALLLSVVMMLTLALPVLATSTEVSDGDYSQFSIDYTANTKYTGVETSPGNYPTCAKTGDVYVNRHGVHIFCPNDV